LILYYAFRINITSLPATSIFVHWRK